MNIHFDNENLKGHVDDKDYKAIWPKLEKAHKALAQKTGKGAKLTGWVDLPSRMDDAFLDEMMRFGQASTSPFSLILQVLK